MSWSLIGIGGHFILSWRRLVAYLKLNLILSGKSGSLFQMYVILREKRKSESFFNPLLILSAGTLERTRRESKFRSPLLISSDPVRMVCFFFFFFLSFLCRNVSSLRRGDPCRKLSRFGVKVFPASEKLFPFIPLPESGTELMTRHSVGRSVTRGDLHAPLSLPVACRPLRWIDWSAV